MGEAVETPAGLVPLVAVAFMSLLVYLFHLARNHSPRSGTSLPVGQVVMTTVTNPCCVELDEANSSLDEGARLSMSCVAECHVRALWGADTSRLFSFLRTLGPDVLVTLDGAREDMMVVDTSTHALPRGNSSLHVMTSDPPSLGPAPRAHFPLVLVATPDDDVGTGAPDPVVASIYLVHLRDEECTKRSRVIASYVLTRGGVLVLLQALFCSGLESVGDDGDDNPYNVPGLDPSQRKESSENPPTSPDNSPTDDEIPSAAANVSNATETMGADGTANTCGNCVVCHVKAATCVNLPCRHVVTCQTCFHLVHTCPMCRDIVTSYFLVGREEDEEEEEKEWEPKGLLPKIRYWNRRLNRWLGFE